MIFKPPYWHHDNIKFSDEDLKILKYEIDGLREKKYLNLYKKIVADITKSVGIYFKVTYDVSFWTQLYEKGMSHNPHHHAMLNPDWDSAISWVHF